jgi:hypothetical protein
MHCADARARLIQESEARSGTYFKAVICAEDFQPRAQSSRRDSRLERCACERPLLQAMKHANDATMKHANDAIADQLAEGGWAKDGEGGR